MRTCCVAGCDVTSDKDVTFFEFPTSRTLRRKWLDCFQLSGKLTVASLVCSQHFTSEDYESFRGKIRLKRKVVPSKFQKEENTNSITKTPEVDINKPNDKCSEIKTTNKSEDFINSDGPFIGFDVIDALIKDATLSENKDSENNENKDSIDNDNVNNDNQTKKDSKEMVDEEMESDSTMSAKDDIFQDNKDLNDKENVTKSTPQTTAPYSDPLEREDIEDMITNYHIKNKKKTAENTVALDKNVNVQCAKETSIREDVGDISIEIEVPGITETEPVFIEVSVGQGENSSKEAENDCLMLLESVQVDVDPALLLLPERDMDEEADAFDVTTDSEAEDEAKPKKKENLISLLTSSDDDEVIIQEPKIDTVEVSDETDEDDVPLVKLIKRKKKSDKKPSANPKHKSDNLAKLMWRMIDYYCIQCHYNTTNRGEYSRHLSTHSKVFQICQICSYTTASKSQFVRHKRKHKEERRFKCHLCDYKARHNMSLMYHLKSHEDVDLNAIKKNYKCEKCNFYSDVKSELVKHIRSCRFNGKKYSCDKCMYQTKRRSDLKRHKARLHIGDDDSNYA